MKAIATVSMYDMGATDRQALNHSLTLEQRKAILAEAAAQRYVEFTGGATRYTSGTEHALTESTHPIQREFFDFYRTQHVDLYDRTELIPLAKLTTFFREHLR
jgi:uncharacterized protein